MALSHGPQGHQEGKANKDTQQRRSARQWARGM